MKDNLHLQQMNTMEKKHTVRTVPKSNGTIVGRCKIKTSNSHILDILLSWLDIGISIKMRQNRHLSHIHDLLLSWLSTGTSITKWQNRHLSQESNKQEDWRRIVFYRSCSLISPKIWQKTYQFHIMKNLIFQSLMSR
jgi:hypothetical protein